MKQHVIYDDDRKVYFRALMLGMFWECVSDLKEARKFSTRAAAAKVMRDNGKQHYGWRVVTIDTPRTSSHTTFGFPASAERKFNNRHED